MRVHEVMTAPARACLPTDSLHTAAEIMWSTDCGFVPVIDEQRHVVGTVTDRDICMAAHNEGKPLGKRTVDMVMSPDPCTCRAEDSVREAAHLMGAQRVRRVPVLDADERLVGVLSLVDLADAATDPARCATAEITAEDIVATLATIARAPANEGSAEPD